MSIRNHFVATGRTRSSQATIASPSTPSPHFAASRKAQKARASEIIDTSSESSESTLTRRALTRASPDDFGIQFEIDWDNIWVAGQKLEAYRLGYRVKSVSQAGGFSTRSKI